MKPQQQTTFKSYSGSSRCLMWVHLLTLLLAVSLEGLAVVKWSENASTKLTNREALRDRALEEPPFLVLQGTLQTCDSEDSVACHENRSEGEKEYGKEGEAVPHTTNRKWGSHRNPASSCQDLNEMGYISGEYWIKASDETKAEVYFCEMERYCGGMAGGWTRVAHLNMTNTSHKCPGNWREIPSPRRTCGRRQDETGQNTARCSAAIFKPPWGLSYDHVCGRVQGYQYCNTMAFWSYYHRKCSISINDPFLDGVTISRLKDVQGDKECSVFQGREHVWSFVSALHQNYEGRDTICPCTRYHPYNDYREVMVPPWVEGDYFCETGANDNKPPTSAHECSLQHEVFYAGDPLWDGSGCGEESSCCQLNGPPWFCKKLGHKSGEPIEVRICGSGHVDIGDTPVEFLEIYVQ